MAAVEMPSWPTVLTAVLTAAFGWQIWSRIRARWQHDLHKLPGPISLPFIGAAPQLFMRPLHIVSLASPADMQLHCCRQVPVSDLFNVHSRYAELCAVGQAIWEHFQVQHFV